MLMILAIMGLFMFFGAVKATMDKLIPKPKMVDCYRPDHFMNKRS